MERENFTDTRFYKYYHDNSLLGLQEFDKLSHLFEFKHIPSESYLLQAGEICNNVFFVEKGLLIMSTLNERGVENIIHFAPEDWLVSDRSSLYYNEPSLFYIKSIEPTTVVVLNKKFAQQASQLSDSFACFNNDALQRNILVQERRIQSLLSMSAKERYLSFLETYPNILLRVPQWMVASYLGITPESLSRIRREISEG